MKLKILTYLLTFLNLITYSSSYTFNIERDRSSNDIIPNDFTRSSGQWLKTSCRNSCGTSYLNTDSQVSGCRCKCKYSHSTFVMNSTPEKSGCIKNQDIRSKTGCNMYFENFGNAANQVAVLPDNGLRLKGNHPFKCQIDGRPQYWDKGQWVTASDDLFQFSGQVFEWNPNAPKNKYSGRIMRQYINNCKWAADSCIVFKAGGTLIYDVTPPTTQPVKTSATPPTTPTIQSTTITTTKATTTKAPTTAKTTTSSTTTTKLTEKTTAPTEHSASPSSEIASQIPVVTAITTQRPFTEQVPTTTERVSTTLKSNAGEKGARAHNSGSGDDDTIAVVAISAVAAITCVVIICVFIWFVLKRRQHTGDTKAYSSGMTVITNSTGPNNTLSGSPVYMEPQDQHPHFPRQRLPLGNPVYSKAIALGNGTNSKNNIPDFELKSCKDTNHYDNYVSVEDEHYACPDYLTKPNNKTNQDNSDYCYSEPEKAIYEELQDKNVRDSMYQPLMRDSRVLQENNTDTPTYLTLIGDDQTTSTNNETIPEYLTILPESSSQSPASPEYDYAAPESRITSTLKRLQTEGQSEQNYHINDSSVQPPVYDVLEAPDSNEQGPVYAVLEPTDENEYLSPVDGEC